MILPGKTNWSRRLNFGKIYKGETYWLTRFVYLRFLGLIYVCVFLPLIFQYQGLLGEKGLLPISPYLERIKEYYGASFWWDLPTLFWLSQADPFALALAYLGLILALVVLLGYANSIILFTLWLLQLSFLHVGQTFWGFGWETNLLEIGFLSIFFAPFLNGKPFNKNYPPSKIIIWLFRWSLFRLIFGAGLIKLRGDACWTELTCLNYHYLTQPIPNPLSPFFHFLPEWFSKFSVLFNHFMELVVPWFLIFSFRIRTLAGILFLIFQFSIIITGNYAWINYLTLLMIIPCFDDRALKFMFPQKLLLKWQEVKGIKITNSLQKLTILLLLVFIIVLSYQPLLNLLGPRQVMNTSYDQFHFVNSYGVFGSVTKKRHELIIMGTRDVEITPQTKWLEYEIPCKPGDPLIMPCIRSPYHYRLTWQIWFAAMGRQENSPWMAHLVYKLLIGEPSTLSL
ncbi:MAG: lipase maturation factor family protein, partial [Deltaproteobacteria bacterium]